MNISITPSSLSGTVKAPGSKSIAQRMVAGALLANGTSTLRQFPKSADCMAALDIAVSLGAALEWDNNDVRIRGGLARVSGEINCSESGLCARMFTPIAALLAQEKVVTGSGTLLSRPMYELESICGQLGVVYSSNQGRLPLYIKGPLRGGQVKIDGNISSQYVSGLLFALPRTTDDSVIEVANLQSLPYVNMTMQVLNKFGVVVNHENYHTFYIDGNQQFKPIDAEVPGDWSGASFLMVAAALCSPQGLEIKNLDFIIEQADSAIAGLLAGTGCLTSDNLSLSVRTLPGSLPPFEFDATHCPDLVPPLAALAAFASGVSTIKGAERLMHKESNRAKVLQDEFSKANVRIAIRDDEMKIYPGHIRQCVINSHNDHRIAMAGSILGLAGDKVTIAGAECVAKSFPGYWDELKKLGARIY